MVDKDKATGKKNLSPGGSLGSCKIPETWRFRSLAALLISPTTPGQAPSPQALRRHTPRV